MVGLVNSYPLATPLPRPEPGRRHEPRPDAADIRLVSRDYLKAMGIPLLSGEASSRAMARAVRA